MKHLLRIIAVFLLPIFSAILVAHAMCFACVGAVGHTMVASGAMHIDHMLADTDCGADTDDCPVSSSHTHDCISSTSDTLPLLGAVHLPDAPLQTHFDALALLREYTRAYPPIPSLAPRLSPPDIHDRSAYPELVGIIKNLL